MKTIQLTCQKCKTKHSLKKTNEIPDNIFFLKCNWCPNCEDRADDYYYEWWDEDENNTEKTNTEPVGDNQLCMPFIFEEINITKNIIQTTS